jgi:hypothetical protein
MEKNTYFGSGFIKPPPGLVNTIVRWKNGPTLAE